jgi:hypothetical protein
VKIPYSKKGKGTIRKEKYAMYWFNFLKFSAVKICGYWSFFKKIERKDEAVIIV